MRCAGVLQSPLDVACSLAVGLVALLVASCGSPGDTYRIQGDLTPAVVPADGACTPGIRPDLEIFQDPRWREQSIRMGSIIFVGLRSAATAPSSRFERGRPAYDPVGVDFLIRPGRRVTIDVRNPKRARLFPAEKLLISGYELSDGVRTMTCSGMEPFPLGPSRAPESRWTQHSAGFVIVGPQCVRLSVTEGLRVMTRRVRFGRRSRCS